LTPPSSYSKFENLGFSRSPTVESVRVKEGFGSRLARVHVFEAGRLDAHAARRSGVSTR
jgi:hypothetical protein